MDCQWSQDIRKELGVEDTVLNIEKYQKQRQEHVERMDPNRPPKLLQKYHPRDRRDQARPCKR